MSCCNVLEKVNLNFILSLQVKLLQELCTKQAEGRMSVVVISDQEKFRYVCDIWNTIKNEVLHYRYRGSCFEGRLGSTLTDYCLNSSVPGFRFRHIWPTAGALVLLACSPGIWFTVRRIPSNGFAGASPSPSSSSLPLSSLSSMSSTPRTLCSL